MNIKLKLLSHRGNLQVCTYLFKGRAAIVPQARKLSNTHVYVLPYGSAFIPVLVTFPIKPTRAEAPQRHNLQSALAAVYLCLQSPDSQLPAPVSSSSWFLAPGSPASLPTLPALLLARLSLSVTVCVCGRKEESWQPEEAEHSKRI